MGRMLPFILEAALLLWALIDCVQTSEGRVRNIPKLGWIFLIVLLPYVGPIAWFFAGRPPRELGGPGPEPFRLYPSSGRRPEPKRPVAPDDNADFLTNLDAERRRKEALDKWEDDLARREEQWRRDHGDDEPRGA